jgi:hypothetical protein
MRAARTYLLAGWAAVAAAVPVHAQTITDWLYQSRHPRLLFTTADLPALEARITDGGIDDDTYAEVRRLVQEVYPTLGYTDILGLWYGEQAIPCIGIVGHLEQDADALALGKALTLHLVNAFQPDFDEANSGMRLRALALGYDLFFAAATPTERAMVRDEIMLYIQKMVWSPGYQLFEQPPYLGNHSAMFGAALGLAAISVDGQTSQAYLVGDALAMTNRIVDNLLELLFDPEGAYNEGAFYGAWTLRQLVFYFDARLRYDGYAYADDPRFRFIEEWFAYELSPGGGGRSHNLNDSPMNSAPLAQHPTFFNWMMARRASGLSAWLWQHTAGGLGAGVNGATDWTSTILWRRGLPLTEPGSVLPPSRIWPQRGLYCYRSGWPAGTSSNDVVFSFYSGKFRGGHAQEDQNQFALTAYGTMFAMDHGAGSIAKESESHNLVLIDGNGQHNAGSSIGTDGAITDFVLGSFADFVAGDATAAYGTYSEYNAPDVPFAGADWSWGYSGANSVQFARRNVVLVHGAGGPPYAVIMDDIDKDGAAHTYQWRLHTANTSVVNALANPVVISAANAVMDLHLLAPDFSGVAVTTAPYDAGNTDPASILLRVSHTAVNPRFTFLMIPRGAATPAPAVSRQSFAWGCAATIQWGAGVSDVVLRNDSGATVVCGDLATDALTAVVRRQGATVLSYMMARGSSLAVAGTTMASFQDGPASCDVADATVNLDRAGAAFRILDQGINRVLHCNRSVSFTVDQGYVVPGGVTAVPPAVPVAPLSVSARPNPFNPSTAIHIAGARGENASVEVYDVTGRRVRALWSGVAGDERTIVWDGRNDDGGEVSSGSYFVRVVTASRTRSLKITLVK